MGNRLLSTNEKACPALNLSTLIMVNIVVYNIELDVYTKHFWDGVVGTNYLLGHTVQLQRSKL